jgi:hypothetical protein
MKPPFHLPAFGLIAIARSVIVAGFAAARSEEIS